jgi:hypothetical protein
MSQVIQKTPKFIEMDLKVRLPENYVKAAQELLDRGIWDDPSLNYALNCIIYQGLNTHFAGLFLSGDEAEDEWVHAFFDKYGINECDQLHTSEIIKMAWRKEDK